MTAAAPEPKANMGHPVPRYDAAAKVTGRATYASDMPLDNPAYAFLVTSAIAKGRIDGFDLDDARQVRGVIDIVTHENAPKLKESKLFSNGGYAGTTIQPLKSQPTSPMMARSSPSSSPKVTRRRARPPIASRSATRPWRRVRALSRRGPPRRRQRDRTHSSRKTRRSAISPRRSTQPRSNSPPPMTRRPSTTIQWSCLRRAAPGWATTSSSTRAASMSTA
ncbi:hypothetical protein ACVWWO_007097 [Bradyrhizobium sp. F1.13.1]